ncbi:hypothetical protein RFI_35638, partial [Reticulomyxa filosa]
MRFATSSYFSSYLPSLYTSTQQFRSSVFFISNVTFSVLKADRATRYLLCLSQKLAAELQTENICFSSSKNFLQKNRQLEGKGKKKKKGSKERRLCKFFRTPPCSTGRTDIINYIYIYLRIENMGGLIGQLFDSEWAKAVRNGEVQGVQYLLLEDSELLDAPVDSYGRKALHLSVSKGNNAMVYTLLIEGANVNEKAGRDDDTALHEACKISNVELIHMLLRFGADAKQLNRQRKMPHELGDEKTKAELSEERIAYVKSLGRPKTASYQRVSVSLSATANVNMNSNNNNNNNNNSNSNSNSNCNSNGKHHMHEMSCSDCFVVTITPPPRDDDLHYRHNSSSSGGSANNTSTSFGDDDSDSLSDSNKSSFNESYSLSEYDTNKLYVQRKSDLNFMTTFSQQ